MAGGTAIKLKKPTPLLVVSRVALLDWLMRVILAPGTRASAISRTVPDIDAVFCAPATGTNRSMATAPNARRRSVFNDWIADSRKFSFIDIDKMCLQSCEVRSPGFSDANVRRMPLFVSEHYLDNREGCVRCSLPIREGARPFASARSGSPRRKR